MTGAATFEEESVVVESSFVHNSGDGISRGKREGLHLFGGGGGREEEELAAEIIVCIVALRKK